METGMVMDISGRWRRAWQRATMDDGVGHAEVDGEGHQRTMATGMDEGVVEWRRFSVQCKD